MNVVTLTKTNDRDVDKETSSLKTNRVVKKKLSLDQYKQQRENEHRGSNDIVRTIKELERGTKRKSPRDRNESTDRSKKSPSANTNGTIRCVVEKTIRKC
jgi:hypothetical protein